MAGLGRKVFTAGEVLTAANVNGYLMDQSVMVFADSAARSSAIGTATEGMVTYLSDTNLVYAYDGASWNAVGVESVTLTNSTATAYTVASADASNYLRFTGASAVVTVSTATAFTAGQQVQIIDAGGGMTITAGTGVTFQGAGTAGTALTATLGAQYEAVAVMAVDSNTYTIIGNVTLA
jgi:hypothetical protein